MVAEVFYTAVSEQRPLCNSCGGPNGALTDVFTAQAWMQLLRLKKVTVCRRPSTFRV
jgi:hypothetical protein